MAQHTVAGSAPSGEIQSAQTFPVTNYWPTLNAMRPHIEARWSDFATISDETWQRAEGVAAAQ